MNSLESSTLLRTKPSSSTSRRRQVLPRGDQSEPLPDGVMGRSERPLLERVCQLGFHEDDVTLIRAPDVGGRVVSPPNNEGHDLHPSVLRIADIPVLRITVSTDGLPVLRICDIVDGLSQCWEASTIAEPKPSFSISS
mmetsp:Transcript_12451/g.36977  ORF Transcript_12451/g.36977 Transcript_12451/m.36977 type:complete len:138 (-) Transcript_12451:208-621(-)